MCVYLMILERERERGVEERKVASVGGEAAFKTNAFGLTNILE